MAKPIAPIAPAVPQRANVVFGGRSQDAPHSINGRRVLAALPREDEEAYVLVLNTSATTIDDPHGHRNPDGYFVAVYRKGTRLYTLLESDLSWTGAIGRAAVAACENQGPPDA